MSDRAVMVDTVRATMVVDIILVSNIVPRVGRIAGTILNSPIPYQPITGRGCG